LKCRVPLQIAVFLITGLIVFGQSAPPLPENETRKAEPPTLVSKTLRTVEVLSDTQGVNFGPYLQHVVRDVRTNWYDRVPVSARAPLKKKGKVLLEFQIRKDGTIANMHYGDPPSGDEELDRAAYGAIVASGPFPPLPSEFKGPYLALRFTFFYNPDKGDVLPSPVSQSPTPNLSK
jgi:TonB family protein